MERRLIKVELLPHKRAAILGANFYEGDEVQAQLDSHASSPNVATIIFSGADVHLLAGDLNHAIVKRGCRDEDIINLSDRFDDINDTSDGSARPDHRRRNAAASGRNSRMAFESLCDDAAYQSAPNERC